MNNTTTIIKTRFAPSPTGAMHFGNLRTALFNYLFAKKNGGEFLLRIEDTDRARSTTEYVASILDNLKLFNLNWDGEVIYQSTRMAIYEEFYQKLVAKNLVYRCFCSEEKLALMRKLQLSQSLPPRYAGTCLNLTDEEINNKLANQEAACWRFKVPKNQVITFVDLIKGQQTFNSNDFGDFIIKRQDAVSPFMFCNAIDDAMQGVTHALRGEDHLTNTPRQLLILEALGLKAPEYGHFPLISDLDGSKLSKRSSSASIQDLLSEGYLPETLLNYLARLGHNYAIEDHNLLNQILSLEQLAVKFNVNNISLNPAKHDVNHLDFWQKQAMLLINEDRLLKILQQNIEFNNIFNQNNNRNKLLLFLNLIKTNIIMPSEAIKWAKAFFADSWDTLEISNESENILKTMNIDLLNIIVTSMENNLNFSELCEQLKTAGFTGKNLFMSLRIIFTGQTYGAELNKIFEIVGTERIKNRAISILHAK